MPVIMDGDTPQYDTLRMLPSPLQVRKAAPVAYPPIHDAPFPTDIHKTLPLFRQRRALSGSSTLFNPVRYFPLKQNSQKLDETRPPTDITNWSRSISLDVSVSLSHCQRF